MKAHARATTAIARVHDAETQEDRHQTDIALGAMEAEAQAVSQGRAGVGRHFAATGAEVVFHDVRPLPLLSPRRLQVVAEIAAESWNSSCEFAIVDPLWAGAHAPTPALVEVR